jgi:hypothetical protein
MVWHESINKKNSIGLLNIILIIVEVAVPVRNNPITEDW